MCRPSRLILEGRSYVVTSCEPGLRWTRQRRALEVRAGRVVPVSPRLRADERRRSVRQNRVVLAVVATVKSFAEMRASPTGRTASSIRGAREAKRKGRLPGEHGISRPTIAQGRPSDRHHLYAAVRSPCATISRSGPRVRSRHPVFPAPSSPKRATRFAKLGRFEPRECCFMPDLRIARPGVLHEDARECRSKSTPPCKSPACGPQTVASTGVVSLRASALAP